MNLSRVLFAILFIFGITSGISLSYQADGKKIFVGAGGYYRGQAMKPGVIAAKTDAVAVFDLQKNYLDKALLSSGQRIEINDFPVNPYEVADVILEPAPAAVDANTVFIAESGNGDRQFKGPMVASYKGFIKNMPGSRVFLSYCDGFLTGYAETGDGMKYDITTSKEDYLAGKNTVTVSWQNVRLLENNLANAFECFTEDYSFIPSELPLEIKRLKDQNQAGKTGLLECKVSLEGTYDYFELMGSDSITASKYMISVMAHVSKIYEEYLNVRITVPYIKIYTTLSADPYYKANKTTFPQKLNYMPKVWPKLPESSALMCMFTSLSSTSDGSGTAGISFGGQPGIGSLCNMTGKRSYSVFGITGGNKYPNYNYTWDVSVAAHEIGHNFGAPHTHSCYYMPNMIDTCVTKSKPTPIGDACLDGDPKPVLGTIMSYCHISNPTRSVDLSFHPRQIAEMREAAELASCINAPANPYITLLNPARENAFVAGDLIKIRWSSSKVSNISVRFSADSGTNWDVLAPAVPSNDTVFEWKAPEINSDKCLIIVSDASNPDVADTTKLTFSITKPMLTLIEPSQGRSYSIREIMRIYWEANISKVFNIEFTRDGNNWNIIAEGIKGDSHNWDIPDEPCSGCRVRVTDTERNSMVAISQPFDTGNESLSITAPVAGEILCAGSKYNISWQSGFVNLIYLRYSLNGGETWKNNFALIEAPNGQYSWTVPDTVCDNVKIRFIMKDDQKVILDETEYTFKIEKCVPNNVNENVGSGFRLISVVPNPAGSRAFVNYECNDANTESIRLYLVNLLGQVVVSPADYGIDCGRGSISYDFGGLAPGSYMLMASINGKTTGLMVVVE